jgi:uncharacterized protein (DUF983 family)
MLSTPMTSVPPRPPNGQASPPTLSRTTDTPMAMPTARRFGALLWSLVRLKCPNCGRGKVLAGGFKVRERCSRCGFRYERSDDNYFQGAMFVNFMIGGATFALSLLVVLLASWPNVPWNALTYGAPVMMLVFMVVLYPFSKTVWLTADVMIRPVAADELQ